MLIFFPCSDLSHTCEKIVSINKGSSGSHKTPGAGQPAWIIFWDTAWRQLLLGALFGSVIFVGGGDYETSHA